MFQPPISKPNQRSILVFLSSLLLVTIAFPCSGQGGVAQAVLQIQKNAAVLDFPKQLTFQLTASASEVVSEVYLVYGTSGQSCVEGVARREAELAPGNPFKASWVWDFKDSGSLPPGVEVWWQWEAHTASGAVLESERRTLEIEDPRLKWTKLESDRVQVVWSEGSQAFARRILNLANASLDRLTKEAGIRPDRKVRLTVFPSFETLRDAVLFMPEWTGGIAFAEYSVVLLGLPVDSGDWMEEVVPHELAHLVTGERVYNCLGNPMPTWLNEGISVYSEALSNPKDTDLVKDALKKGALPPLHNLAAGFSADEVQARLSYAQSGEIVRYLIEEYGAQKLAILLDAIQSGLRIDPALQQAYGFDTDGLDGAWRISMGFEGNGISSGPATPTAARTAVPTRPLWTPVFGRPSPTSTSTAAPSATPAGLAKAATATPSVTGSPPVPPPPGPPPVQPCLGGAFLLAGLFLAIFFRKLAI